MTTKAPTPTVYVKKNDINLAKLITFLVWRVGRQIQKKKIQIFLKLDLIFLDIKQIAKQEIVHEIIR